jgi:hypothetical protein
MPPRGIRNGSKRERQYEHIKKSQRKRVARLRRAVDMSALTVNKQSAGTC